MKYIIIVPVNNIDRTKLEEFEDQTFNNVSDFENQLGLSEGGYSIFTLSHFMDAWNNGEITESEHWLGYVNILGE